MSDTSAPAHDFAALVEAARAGAPRVAVVLGSGLAAVARQLRPCAAANFIQVPGLAAPSVAGHAGRLLLGDWAGRRTLVLQGRLHYYEGHAWRAVSAPIRTAHFLGARVLLVTNAAGGIRDGLAAGRVMVIRDHFEWTRPRCWEQPFPGGIGRPRPSPYSPRLANLLVQAGRELGMDLAEGVYASVTGPSYETPAEIRALRQCGADAVGMSTAGEIKAAHDLGMECAALSCITNMAAGRSANAVVHHDVLTAAVAQVPRLADLVASFLALLEPCPE